MADEVKAPDSVKAPEGSQSGSPVGAAAPVIDTSQVELQRVRTELGIERKRREDAQRALHARTEELKRYQQPAQEPAEESDTIAGITPEVLAATVHRTAFLTVALENMNDPTAAALVPEVQKLFTTDPEMAARYRRADPADSYRDALKDLRMQAVDAENAELRKQLEARAGARETLAKQAIVSGTTATEGQETLTREDVEKMSASEMEQKFGKDALLRNVVR